MRFSLTAMSAALVVLSGCTGLASKIGGRVDADNDKLSSLTRDVGRTAPGVVAESAPSVAHSEGIWLGKNIVKVGQPTLPPVFFEAATFDRNVDSISEFAERIALRTGIPVKVSPDALAVAGAAAAGNASPPSGSNSTTAPATPPVPVVVSPLASMNAPANSAANARHTPIRISYSNGNFKGLLDTVVARFGVSWKYAGGTIQFFHTDSRTFQINAIPGDSSFSANVVSGITSTGGITTGNGSGGGGGGGSNGVTANNNQNTGVTSRLSVYSSIENSIKAMLSAHGKVVSSPSTGAITVVDTPESLDRIAAYIDNENKALSRQVVINVTVLSVNLSDSDEYGINWTLVYNNLSRNYGIKNAFASADNAIAFSAGVISPTSSYNGTSLIIKALSEQGKVRRQTTASVVTLNNQPVPVQVARQTSYLQSSQTAVVAQVGTTTTLTPGTVTSGFNMSILPHVLTNGTVLLQFSTDISTLRNIRTVESNGNKIESPEMDTRNFLQRVAMKSNETLVISGFEQTDENLDKQGVGQASNFALGGGYKAATSKEVIVVLITPTMMTGT